MKFAGEAGEALVGCARRVGTPPAVAGTSAAAEVRFGYDLEFSWPRSCVAFDTSGRLRLPSELLCFRRRLYHQATSTTVISPATTAATPMPMYVLIESFTTVTLADTLKVGGESGVGDGGDNGEGGGVGEGGGGGDGGYRIEVATLRSAGSRDRLNAKAAETAAINDCGVDELLLARSCEVRILADICSTL